ncbi:MAG TPA: M50 family metallopeptidase [Acidobacteriaceae bacterium]|nr:M50 family metallopeptidase [Acidobacteriaceae bacterium]
MRAVRTFLSWVFALGAVIFLRSSVSALLNIVGWPRAHFPTSLVSAGASAAAPLLGFVYGMACWNFWRGRTSARGWGIAASMLNVALGSVFLYMDRRYLLESPGAFVNADSVLLAIGLGGLIAFRRRDVTTAEESLQPIPGDGTNAILNRVVWIAGAGAFLAGMSWWWRWARMHHLPAEETSFMAKLMVLLAAQLAMVAIHELGHAAVGKALGMKIRGFIAGPLQWHIRDGRWRFRFVLSGFLTPGGATTVVPANPGQRVWREVAMVAAGSCGGLLSGGLALWLVFASPRSRQEQLWLPLAVFATMSLVVSILNLIPFRTKSFYSDGARIWQILAGGPWGDLHRAFSAAAATTVTPLRPRDFDIVAIHRAAEAITVGQQALLLRLLASSYYLDCGRLPEAGQALQDAEAVFQRSAPDIPAELCTAFVFGKAYVQRDGAGTRQWWDRMEAKKPTRHDADYWLARSAFCWSEQRLEEAWDSWEKGNALVKELPRVGVYETDRDNFALLRRELESAAAVAAVP